MQAVSW